MRLVPAIKTTDGVIKGRVGQTHWQMVDQWVGSISDERFVDVGFVDTNTDTFYTSKQLNDLSTFDLMTDLQRKRWVDSPEFEALMKRAREKAGG